MIIKRRRDFKRVETPTCGTVLEVLRGREYSPNIAVVEDIRRTVPHYHRCFEEVYFLLDGQISLRLHDPRSDKLRSLRLGKHELCVIPRGVHHQVIESSRRNVLCVLCVPRFDPRDEHPSDVLPR